MDGYYIAASVAAGFALGSGFFLFRFQLHFDGGAHRAAQGALLEIDGDIGYWECAHPGCHGTYVRRIADGESAEGGTSG